MCTAVITTVVACGVDSCTHIFLSLRLCVFLLGGLKDILVSCFYDGAYSVFIEDSFNSFGNILHK